MNTRSASSHGWPVWRSRRGAVLLVVVLLLAVVNLMVVAAATASAGDAHTATLRLETLRAFYAAESGGVVVIRSLEGGPTLPSAGGELDLGSATVRYDAVPTEPGTIVVRGTSASGWAVRRVRIVTE